MPLERETSRLSQSLCYDPCTPLYDIGVSLPFCSWRERRCSRFWLSLFWASELIGSITGNGAIWKRTNSRSKQKTGRRQREKERWASQPRCTWKQHEVKQKKRRKNGNSSTELYTFGYEIKIVHNAPEQRSSARARLHYAQTGFVFPLPVSLRYLFRLRSFHGSASRNIAFGFEASIRTALFSVKQIVWRCRITFFSSLPISRKEPFAACIMPTLFLRHSFRYTRGIKSQNKRFSLLAYIGKALHLLSPFLKHQAKTLSLTS